MANRQILSASTLTVPRSTSSSSSSSACSSYSYSCSPPSVTSLTVTTTFPSSSSSSSASISSSGSASPTLSPSSSPKLFRRRLSSRLERPKVDTVNEEDEGELRGASFPPLLLVTDVRPVPPITITPPSEPDFPASAAAAASPRSLDAVYDVRGEIGSGHFSTVYAATRRIDGARFAVKRILKGGYGGGHEGHLQEEIAIHSGLRHRGILRLEETFETETEWQLVLQRAEGGELFSLVEQGPIPESRCKALTLSLLQAVSHIHSRGVVHRDIKPENILLGHRDDDGVSGDVLLADFGLATVLGHGEVATKPCGSFEYAAPEILRKSHCFSGGYTHKVDMWSVGVILFVILGGYHPFQDDDERRAYKRIITGTSQFHSSRWAHISDHAKDLVKSLLQVDPIVRLSATEALAHPWFTSS